jgi:hypothetical protein
MPKDRNQPKPAYCELCQIQVVVDWKAHIHSFCHAFRLVDPAYDKMAQEYLANMRRPLIE